MSWSAQGPVPRKYSVQLNGELFESRTLSGVFNQLAALKSKRGEVLGPNWEEPLWEELQKVYPSHIKKNREKGISGVSIPSALSFLRFMLKRARNRKLVSLEVAERRAAVCLKCPMRRNIVGCHICKDALKWAGALPIDIDIPEGCGACGCWLRGKVQFPRDILGDSDAFPYWEKCWMRLEQFVD